MKRNTALRYAVELHRRIKSVNGLLATPLCENEAVRIRRVWIFGSTVKGSMNPNDLDVLIDYKAVGRHRTAKQGKLDKRYKKATGSSYAISSTDYAYKWLTKNMRMVSRHNFQVDENVAYPRVMIYPRFDLTLI